MASKSARKRRKRRPPPPGQTSALGSDAGPQSSPPATVRPPPRRRPSSAEPGPPPAPWGSFPLVELSVLIGIVMLIVGFFFVTGSRGPILIATGLILGSIGGLELSIREHFSGYQSHTTVLAGVPALVVLGVLFYTKPDSLSQFARAGIGLGVFAVAALLLTRAFASRSGGLRYRVQSLRSRDR